jgi:hypothetical protein
MAVLDLSVTQLQILSGVLTPLSLSLPDGSTANPVASTKQESTGSQPQLQQEEQLPLLSVHELSLFLLAQLFSKEAQRPDNVEVWPEAGPSLSPLSVSDNMCSSPTRTTMGRSPSGAQLARVSLSLTPAAQHVRARINLPGMGWGIVAVWHVKDTSILAL